MVLPFSQVDGGICLCQEINIIQWQNELVRLDLSSASVEEWLIGWLVIVSSLGKKLAGGPLGLQTTSFRAREMANGELSTKLHGLEGSYFSHH